MYLRSLTVHLGLAGGRRVQTHCVAGLGLEGVKRSVWGTGLKGYWLSVLCTSVLYFGSSFASP